MNRKNYYSYAMVWNQKDGYVSSNYTSELVVNLPQWRRRHHLGQSKINNSIQLTWWAEGHSIERFLVAWIVNARASMPIEVGPNFNQPTNRYISSASCPFTFPLLTAFSLTKSEKAEKQKSRKATLQENRMHGVTGRTTRNLMLVHHKPSPTKIKCSFQVHH